MKLLYRIGISLYYIAIYLVSPFNHKAGLWVKGRKNWREALKDRLKGNKRPVVWMHCSSLGEFEQGRPVIESLKSVHPECFILVSFFSPSGFEVRKDFKGADFVSYLPLDYKANAEFWMETVKPACTVFVKYEFWYVFLKELKKRRIPTILISANFREDQVFFKWYGEWYRKMLNFFTLLFVQHQSSLDLLSEYGINSAVVAGDTRFDRVYAISSQVKEIPVVKSFCEEQRIVIAGSTWEPDEEILVNYINAKSTREKFILVPHEISEFHLRQLEGKLQVPSLRFSLAAGNNPAEATVLIIDNVGMLSSLYRYAGIAYIGGGFGKGIHNTLEAATFGMPIIFGPNYQRFREAVELVNRGCAFPVEDYGMLNSILTDLINDEEQRKTIGEKSASFVKESTGATALIVESIEKFIS
jgi:3-deoxy-D-manno-octulosonic-acid transferase